MIDKIYVIWHKEDFRKDIDKRLKICFPDTEVGYIDPAPDGNDPNFKQWMKDNNYDYMKDWKQGNGPNPEEEYTGFWSRDIKTGEIACAIGHHRAWCMAKKDKVKRALFLEQDSIIRMGQYEKLDKLLSTLQNGGYYYDIIYTGHCPASLKYRGRADEYGLVKPLYVWCLHSYVVTNKGVDILLKNNFEKNLFPVDDYVASLNVIDYIDLADTEMHPKLVHLQKQISAYVLEKQLFPQMEKDYGLSGTEGSPYIN